MKQDSVSHFRVQAILVDVTCSLERPVTQKKLSMLFQKLTSAQKICTHPMLQEEIITLYGKTIDAFNLYLEQAIANLHKIKTATLLKKKITALKKCQGISDKNLMRLAILEKKKLTARALPPLKPLCIDRSSIEDMEVSFEKLLDLAGLFYKEETAYIPQGLFSLAATTRKRIQRHFGMIQNIHPKQEEKTSILQAIFATAYEPLISDTTSYLSLEEIELFFQEIEQIHADNALKERIIPFLHKMA